jgi:hypothetical protein
MNVRAEKLLADEKSANAHIMLTKYKFKFPQHNAYRLHSTLPNAVDAEKIVRVWCVTVKAKTYEERRENRPNRLTFVNELSDADMNRRYDSHHALWETFPKCHMRFNDSFQ